MLRHGYLHPDLAHQAGLSWAVQLGLQLLQLHGQVCQLLADQVLFQGGTGHSPQGDGGFHFRLRADGAGADPFGRPDPAADNVPPAGADEDLPVAVNPAVDNAVGLQILPDKDGGVLYILGKDAAARPDNGGPVPQDALDHRQVAPGLHGASGFHHAAHIDVPHGLDGKAAEHVAFDVDVPHKFDIPGGKIHIAVNVQHWLDLEGGTAELHVARHGGDEGVPVLGDFSVAPLGEGHGLSALGGNFLVGHRPARLTLGGTDEVADFLSLLRVADEVQGRVVHLAKLIDLQHPLNFPGEIVHNVAVAPIEGVLPLCYQVQVEIAVPLPGRPVQEGRVQAKGNPLGRQGLVNHVPGHVGALSHGGENQHPGIDFIRGEIEPGAGVHHQLFLLSLRLSLGLFLAVLAPGPALGRLQPGAADALQGRLQPVHLFIQHLRRQHAVLVHAQMRVGQRSGLLLAEFVELADGVVRWYFQAGRIVGGGLRNTLGLLGRMLLLREKRLIHGLLFFRAEQKG